MKRVIDQHGDIGKLLEIAHLVNRLILIEPFHMKNLKKLQILSINSYHFTFQVSIFAQNFNHNNHPLCKCYSVRQIDHEFLSYTIIKVKIHQ